MFVCLLNKKVIKTSLRSLTDMTDNTGEHLTHICESDAFSGKLRKMVLIKLESSASSTVLLNVAIRWQPILHQRRTIFP